MPYDKIKKMPKAPDNRVEDHTNRGVGQAILDGVISVLHANANFATQIIPNAVKNLVGVDMSSRTDPWTGAKGHIPLVDSPRDLMSDKELEDMYTKSYQTLYVEPDGFYSTRTRSESEARKMAKNRMGAEKILREIQGADLKDKPDPLRGSSER